MRGHREQRETRPGGGGGATDQASPADVNGKAASGLQSPRLSMRASFKRLSELPELTPPYLMEADDKEEL